MDTLQKTLTTLPHTPGIYLFIDKQGSVIYVGKARDVSKRIHQYFARPSLLTDKTRHLSERIHAIKIKQVATEFEALLLEAKFIRSYAPKYNMIAKDDKSPIYIQIKNIKNLPIVVLTRKPKNHSLSDSQYFGPFATSRIALRILRMLRPSIPFCQQKVRNGKPCFYTHLGLCNPCPSVIERMPAGTQKNTLALSYKKNVKRLTWVLSGRSKKTIESLRKEMNRFSNEKKFEQAGGIRDQIQALLATINNQYNPFVFEEKDTLEKAPEEQTNNLLHILQQYIPTLTSCKRIECYDISTLKGSASVGSMIVFVGGIPHTDQYRRFKIRITKGKSDVDMMKEVVSRRFHHSEWNYPDLIVVDGGKPQVSACVSLLETIPLHIPVIGLSKRLEKIVIPFQNGFKEIAIPYSSHALQLLQHVRDEAHRWAISYHKKLRARIFAQHSSDLIYSSYSSRVHRGTV